MSNKTNSAGSRGTPPGFCERPEQAEQLKELNRRNREFYRGLSTILAQKLTPTSHEIALSQRKADEQRGIPLRYWTYERAVIEGADSADSVRSTLGRIGGRSRKTDALQELIIATVRKAPRITETQLLARLRAMEHGEVIEEVDHSAEAEAAIHFQKKSGMPGRAPLSGLKDRLARAKKIVREEFARTR